MLWAFCNRHVAEFFDPSALIEVHILQVNSAIAVQYYFIKVMTKFQNKIVLCHTFENSLANLMFWLLSGLFLIFLYKWFCLKKRLKVSLEACFLLICAKIKVRYDATSQIARWHLHKQLLQKCYKFYKSEEVERKNHGRQKTHKT